MLWSVVINLILTYIILTGLRERDKRERSEEKIDCHHQGSNQGPSLVASDALTTELWCSRHPVNVFSLSLCTATSPQRFHHLNPVSAVETPQLSN